MTSADTSKESILEQFKLFEGGTGGLDSWLKQDTPDTVFDVLASLHSEPLTRARFNQLLTLVHEAPISPAMYSYYWLETPVHTYDVCAIPGYDNNWQGADSIRSTDQLYWGLYRFYVDALLYFGSIRTAYQSLRKHTSSELSAFFASRRIEGLTRRGDPLILHDVAKDNRYLISEMACKSFEVAEGTQDPSQLEEVLLDLLQKHRLAGGGPVTARQLLTGEYAKKEYLYLEPQMELSADDFIDVVLSDDESLRRQIRRVAEDFIRAREAGLANTELYLSMVGDLDVYIATSMRKRQDFRDMANFCEVVFGDERLSDFELRHFDPTLSAAQHHEDKGVIECLMVKCAMALLYNAGSTDSYGKDAEAAMALSLGKPVIIFADEEFRSGFFRDIHPLSRLINFESGVVVGAMVATTEDQVVRLLERIFTNTVEYCLEQPRPQYLVLKERITDSVVRLQTSDGLLRETFWNHYHTR